MQPYSMYISLYHLCFRAISAVEPDQLFNCTRTHGKSVAILYHDGYCQVMYIMSHYTLHCIDHVVEQDQGILISYIAFISFNSIIIAVFAACVSPVTQLPLFIVCQESFDGQMTEDNIEIGISNSSGFRKLQPSDIQDYLATIQ